jgi:hypothetical protein
MTAAAAMPALEFSAGGGQPLGAVSMVVRTQGRLPWSWSGRMRLSLDLCGFGLADMDDGAYDAPDFRGRYSAHVQCTLVSVENGTPRIWCDRHL